jgi:hypothetical protein
MGRFFAAFLVALVCIGARVAATDDSSMAIEGMTTSMVVLTSSAKANHLDGVLIRSVVANLRVVSPTFRDILAAIAASPRLLVLISPSTDVRYVDGMMGRTRFQVGPDRVVAFVDIFVDRANTRTRQEAIAHELGHIAEVACIGAYDDQESLRRLVRRRADWFGMSLNTAILETPFAVTIGQQVIQEAKSKTRSASQFTRLTEHSGLTACPALPADDGFTAAQ